MPTKSAIVASKKKRSMLLLFLGVFALACVALITFAMQPKSPPHVPENTKTLHVSRLPRRTEDDSGARLIWLSYLNPSITDPESLENIRDAYLSAPKKCLQEFRKFQLAPAIPGCTRNDSRHAGPKISIQRECTV